MPVPLQKFSADTDAPYLKRIEYAPRFVWKRFGDGERLETMALFPDGHTPDKRIPAVAFFHGGMWKTAHSTEFYLWMLQLASRGVACFLPSYRTHAEYDVGTADILQDASDFWSWLLGNADELGLDDARLCLAGSDAGGLMALHAGMPPLRPCGWRNLFSRRMPQQPLPACVALFRGVVDMEAPEAALYGRRNDSAEDVLHWNPPERLGRRLPALFSAHGMLDPLLDYRRSEWFADEWAACGNEARCISCPHGDHAFLYFNVNPLAFEQILFEWENFMVEQGIWAPSQAEGELLLY